MKKKLSTFLTMLFALSLMTNPIAAQGTETVQVGYGTDITEGAPIINWWKCSFQGTESIYFKDDLGLMPGDKIVSLSYYCMRGSASGGNFNVRMKNTSISSFQVGVNDYDPSTIEIGYEEPVYGNTTLGSYSGGEWITFNLQTPFVYEGENIIIDIRNTAPASRHGWCYFAETRYYGSNSKRSICWRQAKSENPHSDGFYQAYDSGIYGNDEITDITGTPNVLIEYIPADDTPVTEFTINDICYKVNRDGESVTVTYSDSSNDYANNYAGLTTANIPETVTYQGKTYSVTAIGKYAFRNCSSLTSAIVPNTVKTINTSFYSCVNLQNVEIGNSVTSISGNAFRDCHSLTSIELPNSLLTIGGYTFMGCENLTTASLGNSLTLLGRSAFSGCVSLAAINFPETLASIGTNAFYNCKNLKTLEIPSSLNSIGEGAFDYCSSLFFINVDENNAWYDSRNNCNAIIESQRNRLIHGCMTSNIPATVTNIADKAFVGCTGLQQIIIPAAVDTIGEQVFRECPYLYSISVDANNTIFDSRNNCNAIIETATNTLIAGCRNTVIPANITAIGEFAFFGQNMIKTINIPPSVEIIGRSAFNSCTSLTKFIIPNSVTSLGNFVFSGCTGLEDVTISSGLTTIGRGAFYGCTALNKIVSNISKPKDVMMGSDVFKNVDYSSCILYVPNGTRNIYLTADQWKQFEIIKIIGDVDDDGVVSSADITALYNHLLDNNNDGIVNGDLDGDGYITAGDITIIYNILLGN